MSDSTIGISTGTDAYLAAQDRTVGGTAVEEQIIRVGYSLDPTYAVIADDVSVATVNDHVLQVMADGTNYCRLLGMNIQPTDNGPASDALLKLQLVRLTTAGSGGGALNDSPYDDADSFGGDMRSLPTSKGTEGDILRKIYMPLDSVPQGIQQPHEFDALVPEVQGKPIIWGPATSDGLAVKVENAVASAAICVTFVFAVTTYL